MYYFTSDYTTGCTPEILEVLGATNLEETAGYGEDAYCEAARALIQKECGRPDADVYFMMAGTQTNLTIISASLRPFHGVYGTARSHINTHEAGAIERSGHKVLVVPDEDGKITAVQIAAEQEKYLHDPSREHIVMPKMVYISQPTETGTLYSKRNWKIYTPYASSIIYTCLLTVRASVTGLLRPPAILPCRTLQITAMCSTSAAPNAACCSAKRRLF